MQCTRSLAGMVRSGPQCREEVVTRYPYVPLGWRLRPRQRGSHTHRDYRLHRVTLERHKRIVQRTHSRPLLFMSHGKNPHPSIKTPLEELPC
jgi:hypothetical protein